MKWKHIDKLFKIDIEAVLRFTEVGNRILFGLLFLFFSFSFTYQVNGLCVFFIGKKWKFVERTSGGWVMVLNVTTLSHEHVVLMFFFYLCVSFASKYLNTNCLLWVSCRWGCCVDVISDLCASFASKLLMHNFLHN